VKQSDLCGIASSSCQSEPAYMRSSIYGDTADSTFSAQRGAVYHLQAAGCRESHSIHRQCSREEGEQSARSASGSDVEVGQARSCRSFESALSGKRRQLTATLARPSNALLLLDVLDHPPPSRLTTPGNISTNVRHDGDQCD
jgi:hypothetical protein